MALFARGLARIAVRANLPSARLLTPTASRSYSSLSFTFASPSEVFFDNAKVTQVDVPSLNGSFGILAEHVPTLAVLAPGVVTVTKEDSTLAKYFVSSGSVTVNADSSVQILAEEVAPLDRLDVHAIREGATKAQHEVGAAQTDQAKAEAQIAYECFEALQKALS